MYAMNVSVHNMEVVYTMFLLTMASMITKDPILGSFTRIHLMSKPPAINNRTAFLFSKEKRISPI